jgi:hypothetical protein
MSTLGDNTHKANIMAMSSSLERSHSLSELESYEEELIYKQRYLFLNRKALQYSLSRWRGDTSQTYL